MAKSVVSKKAVKDYEIFEFHGEFALKESLEFESNIIPKLAPKTPKIILDLTKVEFLDSNGIGIILKIFKIIKKAKGSILVVKPKDNFCASILEDFVISTGGNFAHYFQSKEDYEEYIGRG